MLTDLLPTFSKENEGNLLALLGRLLFPACLSLLGWIIYTRFAHPLHDIPGPIWASITRFWLVYKVSTGKAEYDQRDLHEKLGPLVRIAPDEISVSDPSAIKIIYAVKSGFSKTDFYPPFAPNITPHGDHFTQLDESKHAERRKLVNNVYSMSTVLESEAYINNCTDVLLSKMSKFAKAKQSIDIGEWCQWYTFDVVGELFFGQQFGFMSGEHDFDNYIRSLDTLLPGIAISCVLPPYLRYLQPLIGPLIPSIRNSVLGFDNIRHAAKRWVTHRMQKMEGNQVDRSDLLDKFFSIRAQKSDFDIPEIQNEACVAIFAGSDTTAIAIRSILYHLMKNPSAYDKLVAEIDEATREGRLSTPHLKYSEAVKLPYLVACCKEGMRLHPSVGLSLPRYVPEGGKVIVGRFFPAGTKIGVSAPVVHLNKSIFGPDAAAFNPERWLHDSESAAIMDRYMFQFGAGSRTCIGKNISITEIHKMIPELLRLYRVELVDPQLEWKTHNFWFNKQTGIQVHVTARKGEN